MGRRGHRRVAASRKRGLRLAAKFTVFEMQVDFVEGVGAQNLIPECCEAGNTVELASPRNAEEFVADDTQRGSNCWGD